MRKGLFCMLIVVFSMPLLAQNTPQELGQKQFQELMEQFFGQNSFFNQLSDTTFAQIPNGGLLKFYNFSDADSLMQQFPMEDLQKFIEQQGYSPLKNPPFGVLEPLDLEALKGIIPDSLSFELEQQLAPLLERGKEGDLLENEDVKPKSKKKRKTYSL